MEQRVQFFTTRDGVRIAYATLGDGPPLVYVTGWPVHLQIEWELGFIRDFLCELAGDFTLIRYDMRGAGLSDRGIGPFTFDDLVDDLGDLIEHLRLEHVPLLTLGGFAAPIAIEYAARHPDLVERLVVHSGYIRGTDLGDGEQWQVVVDYTRNFGFPIFKFVDHPGLEMEQQRAMYDLHEQAASHEVQAAVYGMMYEVDVSEAAASLNVPVLALHSRDDQLVSYAGGRQLAATIPGAEFVSFAGSSVAPWAHRGLLIPEIHRFLGESRAPGKPPHGISPREADVLRLIAAGKSNRQISEELSISVHTADRHVSNILTKIGASNRAEAASFAVRHGLAQ
jgi:pimeloyl-ACP methyl ester carboxylesterase